MSEYERVVVVDCDVGCVCECDVCASTREWDVGCVAVLAVEMFACDNLCAVYTLD